MNSWQGMGRLTADPVLKTTGSDITVCTFTVAINRQFLQDGERKADFINCVAWRKTGEFIEKYFKKGNMIALEGTVQTRSWEDNEGNKRYATEIIVNQAHFCGANENKDEGNKKSKPDTTKKKSPPPSKDDSEDEDDLPF